ncbi:MAG: ATP-dependent Clp protease ATP-binding subunit [Oscillospiraceae bacterium]|nr:ATP-dependent Clp protease ATP-binding subunit [Oscillospiraceae bacterium]
MNLSDLTKRFSDGAKRVLGSALSLAKELGHTYIGSEHLLAGIVAEGESTASRLLSERGVTESELRRRIVGIVGTGVRSTVTTEDLTPTCRRILMRASLTARGGGRNALIGTEHLLMALLNEECVGKRLAEGCGADANELLDILEELYGREKGGDVRQERREPERVRKSTPTLDKNATNLTEKALFGHTDPVVGREKEEEQVISILLRRTKNNPCLVGEAGVGKTAIVESVAARIAEGRVPEPLLGKRIMSLELASIVAGTKYRGEFEEKIRSILAEAREAEDVILFIDEIHTIVGAGAAEGAIDASNILKPSLARGEIKLIGATTQKEYKRCIEKDAALDRRFRRVSVEEPTEAECLRILYGLREKYENFHGVRLLPEALESAVRLSARYISDRYLPDKAIDLIDEAAACKRMRGGTAVTGEDIAAAAQEKTGIPLTSMSDSEAERLRRLEAGLKERILGQDAAVEAVCSALRRAGTGVREAEKPACSFLLIGPSGVGKTACAKALAELLYGKDAFLRLDMTEYAESHSVSKLIGAPPGYSGYGEGGLLTERIRRRPYSLVLFDEVEKAHPEVRALLLQILDEGKLTDSAGLTVSFRNAAVVLTANMGETATGIGFASSPQTAAIAAARARAEALLSRELVDRVDELAVFRLLGREALEQVARGGVHSFAERLRQKGIGVRFDDSFLAQALVCSQTQSPAQGSEHGSAREVRRQAVRAAEELISGGILDGSVGTDCDVLLCAENGQYRMKISQKSC